MSHPWVYRVSVAAQLAATALAFSVLGCTLWPATETTGFPPVLNVENRGGPDLIVDVNGAIAATLACDSGAEVVPGELGVAGLPWNLTIKRRVGNVILLAGHVTELPKWFVQIGETSLGLGSKPVAGPAGPPCPSG
jgi:hypothetical protein